MKKSSLNKRKKHNNLKQKTLFQTQKKVISFYFYAILLVTQG